MKEKNNVLIITTILIALVLTLLPMPDWTVWLRPAWVMMVVVYWIVMQPEKVGIGIAWIIGILLDVLSGMLLGENALAMAIVAYFASRFYIRLRMYPILQQAMSILFFAFVYQFVLYCIQGFLGELPSSQLYWLSPVTTVLLWPWVFMILQDCRRRFYAMS